MARELVSQKLDFSKYAKLKLDNNFIAEVLINYPKEIKKRFGLKGLKEKDFLEVFGYLIEGKIVKGNVIDILVKKIKKEKITFSKALDDKEIEKRLKELVKKNPKTPIGGLMGDAMKMFKGKVDGKKVMTILRKLVK